MGAQEWWCEVCRAAQMFLFLNGNLYQKGIHMIGVLKGMKEQLKRIHMIGVL